MCTDDGFRVLGPVSQNVLRVVVLFAMIVMWA